MRAAREGLSKSDLLVVIGGASVGDHDHVRKALAPHLGLQLACPKIAVRPGKPTWFGETPMGRVLGFPGNPASALICAYLFLQPIIEAMLGRDPLDCVRTHRAQLAVALPGDGPLERYLRANVRINDEGCLCVKAFENQDTSLLSGLERANALIRRPPLEPTLAEGMGEYPDDKDALTLSVSGANILDETIVSRYVTCYRKKGTHHDEEV